MSDNVFDLCSSPIVGRYLIEASAGTGKTYSLEHLVLRFVVELGVSIDRILIVTFTNAATAEIKERVRTLLQRMAKALTQMKQTEDAQVEDFLKDKTEAKMVRNWISEDKDPLEMIARALDSFDDASVQTIHSFCQKMLTEYNFTRGGSYDVTYGPDTGLDEVVIDEFVRREAAELNSEDAKILLESDVFAKVLPKLVQIGDTVREIHFPEEDEEPKTDFKNAKAQLDYEAKMNRRRVILPLLKRFVKEAPARLAELERQTGVMSFDALLIQMYRLVNTNTELVEKIRKRFDAVLIDEFQDTDSLQYGVFRELFLPKDKHQGPKSVFFVGDPKQAIYSFRMAELSTYLQARRELLEADPKSILQIKKNFRTTKPVVAAVNAVFKDESQNNSHFLTEELKFSEADFGSSAAPLVRRIGNKLYPIPAVSFWLNPDGELPAGDARELQAKRVAQDIAKLLAKGDVLIKRDSIVDGEKRSYRQLKPGDIAILVRQRTDAGIIVDELARRGVRAAISGTGDVFATEEALEIAAVLNAMAEPLNRKVVNTARATRLWGRTMAEIRDQADTLGVTDRELIQTCAQRFASAGPSAALMHLQEAAQTAQRLLPVTQGASVLENYGHIIELLQAQFARLKTLGAVLRWYEDRVDKLDGDDDASEARKLRVATDENVVKIDTVHSSKGLEYPVVYIPWGCDMRHIRGESSVLFQEEILEDGSLKKNISLYSEKVSVKGGHQETYERNTQERVRLAYVAMTRASSRLVVSLVYTTTPSYARENLFNGYVQGITGCQDLPGNMKLRDFVPGVLHQRLAEIQHEVGNAFAENIPVNPDDFGQNLSLSDDFKQPEAWVQITNDVDTSETIVQTASPSTQLTAPAQGHLRADWVRSSFTSIASGLHSAEGEVTEYEGQERVVETDESVSHTSIAVLPETDAEQPVFDTDALSFFRGADVGDWLHKLFETMFNRGDQDQLEKTLASVRGRLSYALFMQGKTQEEFDAVADLVERMITGVVNGELLPQTADDEAFALKSLSNDLRVNEMPFLLSVDNPKLTTKVLLQKLKKAGLNFDADSMSQLSGYLTGAIDMVMFAQGKYWVVDWKSNFIGKGTPKDYTQEAMLEEIERKHYKLQYVIYLLALKRHLVTVAGIAPEEVWDHIGGAMYVFLRGVDADEVLDADGQRNGVFIDCPRNAVDLLDDLLKGN